MAEQTTINALASLTFFHWRGTPSIDDDASSTATILTVTVAPTDKDGSIITGNFLMNVESIETGEVEGIYVPAGAVSADGLTLGTVAKPLVRGLNPSGNDLTGDSDFAQTLQGGSPVACSVDNVLLQSVLLALTQQLACRLKLDFRTTYIGAGVASCPTFANQAAANAAIGTPVNGDRYYDTAIGNTRTYQAGAWNTDGNTGVSNATEGAAGKVELGTLAEQGAQASTGGAGPLVMQCKNTAKAPAIYTPAYLTSGASVETTIATWDSVSDGETGITIDGVLQDIAGMDFTATGPLGIVTSMAEVAAVIQYYIRDATGGLETCAWAGSRLVVTSADTTSSSAVTVTTTVVSPAGTDISGAGAGTYMDSDTGNGVATAKVLDKTQDENKASLLNNLGEQDWQRIPKSSDADNITGTEDEEFSTPQGIKAGLDSRIAPTLTAGESVDGSSTPQAVHLSDGTGGRDAGKYYKSDVDDTTNAGGYFLGFAKGNKSADETDIVYTEGIVGGFTGLTVGDKYYLHTTAGTISNTVSAVPVGEAVSATEIKITPGQSILRVAKQASGTQSNSNVTLTFSLPFKPRRVKIFGNLSAASGAANNQRQLQLNLELVGGAINGSVLKINNPTTGWTTAEYIEALDDTTFSVVDDSSTSTATINTFAITDNSFTCKITEAGGGSGVANIGIIAYR